MNQTIYFQKSVWDTFQHEEKKSKLINELLTSHYNTTLDKPFGDKTVKAISREAATAVAEKEFMPGTVNSVVYETRDVIKTPEEARKVVNADSPGFITKAHTARTKK